MLNYIIIIIINQCCRNHWKSSEIFNSGTSDFIRNISILWIARISRDQKMSNMLKLTKNSKFRKFPIFKKNLGKIPEKFEIWISEFKIKVSDLNWVGKIPHTLKLAKTSQFMGGSRNPDFQFPNSRNFQMSPKVAKN